MISRTLASLALVLCSFSLIARVHKITTLEEYNAAFMSNKPMIAMYSSRSCGPCRVMKPGFIHVSDDNPDIHFCLIDVENPELEEIINGHNIRSIPQVIFSYKGEKIMTERGSMGKETLENCVDRFRVKFTTKKSADKQTTTPKKEAKKAPIQKKEAQPKKVQPSKTSSTTQKVPKKKQKTS